MKNLVIILFLALSFSLSAQRPMTQEEKSSLSTNSIFQEKCKQGIRDYAVYWAAHVGNHSGDGAIADTEAARIKWAKDRILSVAILKNPIISEDAQTLAWIFLDAAQGKNYTLGAAPIDATTLISAWVTANSFEEFSSSYFNVKGDEINFSIGN